MIYYKFTINWAISYYVTVCYLCCIAINFSLYIYYLLSLNFWISNLCLFAIILTLFYFNFQSKVVYICIVVCYYYKLSIFGIYLKYYTILTSLLVGTIGIHPTLFYLCFIFIFILFLFLFKTIYWVKLSLVDLCKLIGLALVLGSVWGFQTGIWGYLWANDSIEWFLFISLYWVLYYYHKVSNQIIGINVVIGLSIAFFVLLSIRLGVITTRHNFLTSSFFNVFNMYIYIILIISFQILFFFKQLNKIEYLSNFKFLFLFFGFILNYTEVILKLFILFFYLYVKTVQKFNRVRVQVYHIISFVLFINWIIIFKCFFLKNIFKSSTYIIFLKHTKIIKYFYELVKLNLLNYENLEYAFTNFSNKSFRVVDLFDYTVNILILVNNSVIFWLVALVLCIL